MTEPTVGMTVSGGQIQGIAGAGSVVIENFTIYNRVAEEPATTGTGTEPIPPCPYPGLAYFGPGDADLFFGRDAAITALAETIGRQSFTALVGSSGSGNPPSSWRVSRHGYMTTARATGVSAISASAPSGSITRSSPWPGRWCRSTWTAIRIPSD